MENATGRQWQRFWIASILLLIITATTYAQESTITLEIHSVKELNALFKRYHYTPDDWRAGIREVPRIYLAEVPGSWRKKTSKQISVIEKKRLFFRLLAPIVLYINERILAVRSKVESLALQYDQGKTITESNIAWLRDLGNEYSVPASAQPVLEREFFTELLRRIDIIPPSLALAQGAIESGWGTSRFADEGNSLFGQWSWSGGMVPAEQRGAEHGDHRIAAFESTGLSVWSYTKNLNTHRAYDQFRRKREELRRQGAVIRGKNLVQTMTAYSERGQAYVEELKTIMRQNKLDPADDAYLAKMEIIRIVPQTIDVNTQ